MTYFVDLLEAFHHGCVSGDCARLEHGQLWLETKVDVPRDETGWHQLGIRTVDWLTPLPVGWEPHWRILSARERTLTVEALDYLEAHRPGSVAAALPPSPTAGSEPTALGDVPVHWSLSDMMDCIRREVQRRETQYPIQLQQGRLSADFSRAGCQPTSAGPVVSRASPARAWADESRLEHPDVNA